MAYLIHKQEHKLVYLEPKDRVILKGVFDGKTYRAMGDEVGLTPRSVQLRIEKMIGNGLIKKFTGPGGQSKHGKAGRKLTESGLFHLEEIYGKNQQ